MDLRSQPRVQVQPRADQVSPVPAAPASAPRKRSNRTPNKKLLLTLVGLLVLAGLAAMYFLQGFGAGGVKSGQYQALFLTNGQVYFGKINRIGGDVVTMSDIYYLQQSSDVQNQDDKKQQSQNQLTLTKLGKELHGPEDTMYIERSQVLFWENLKNDSQVVTTIKKEKEQGN